MEQIVDNKASKCNLTEGQRAFQSQLKDLINNLSSWRDESHRQISNIISSHSRTVDKGINDIFLEISDLQAQVTDLIKEKKALLETVNILNNEIRQISVKLLSAEPETSEFNGSLEDVIDIKEECIEPPTIQSELNEGKNSTDNESNLEEGTTFTTQGDKSVKDDGVSKGANISTHGRGLEKLAEFEQGSFKTPSVKALDRDIRNTRKNKSIHACKECGYATSHSRSQLMRHYDAIHSKGDKRHKCEICPYSSAEKPRLKKHILSVHTVGEKNKCAYCPHSSADKYNLKRHIEQVHMKKEDSKYEKCPSKSAENTAVHKITGQQFGCDQCGYVASDNCHLKRHRDTVHKMGTKLFYCPNCPFSSARTDNVKKHYEAVHVSIRNYFCDDCGYAAKQKSVLKQHCKIVHKKEDLLLNG